MKKIILITLTITFLAVFSWLNTSAISPVEALNVKVTEPVKPSVQQKTQQDLVQQPTKTETAKPIQKKTTLVAKEQAVTNETKDKEMLKEMEALKIVESLLNNPHVSLKSTHEKIEG